MNDKRLLSELTLDELSELYDVNKWLREQCEANRRDSNGWQVEEIADYLRAAKHINFSIGGGYGDFIKVQSGYYAEYLEALQKMQRDFYIVGDDLNKILDRLTEKARFFDDCYNDYEDISYKKYNLLESWFLGNIDEINNYILSYVWDIATDYSDLKDELELIQINNGNDYSTDGTYIFEVNARKYA